MIGFLYLKLFISSNFISGFILGLSLFDDISPEMLGLFFFPFFIFLTF